MSRLGVMPILLVCVTAAAFVTAYVWAVLNDDVYILFPYISDTGAQPPESCVFGQLLNISAFIAGFTMYMRYKAIQTIVRAVDGMESPWIARMNKVSFGFGCIAASGVSIVANFQEGTEVETVHFIGAFLAFVPGVVYCFMQTHLSYHMWPRYTGICVCHVRLAISLLSVVTCVLTIVAGSVSYYYWYQNPGDSTFQWTPDDPGYTEHIISTVSEWVLAFGFFCFYLTFAGEFNKFEVEVVTRALVSHLDHSVEVSGHVTRARVEGHHNRLAAGGVPPEPNERTVLLG